MLWLHFLVKIKVVHINLYINEICNVRKHSIQPCINQLGTWTFISKLYTQKDIISELGLWVFDPTFNNISVISWRSVAQYRRFFLVKENGLSAHYGRAVSGHWHINQEHLDHGWHHTYKVSNNGQLYYYTMGRNSLACIFSSGRVKLIVTSERLNIYKKMFSPV